MQRRRFVGMVLTALLVSAILSAGSAFAQGGRRGMGGRMMGGLQLLRIPQVQAELKMTPEQIGKIDAKQQEVRDAMQGAFQGGGGQPSPEDMQKMMAKVQEVQSKAVKDILDSTQQKRFRQIELQQQGPIAIATRKDVADELKLTDDQKKQIADIQKAQVEERNAAMQGVDFQSMSPEERTALGAKMQKIQAAAGDKITALLTDDQKVQWKTMVGETFKMPAMGPGGGGARRPQ